MADRAVESLRPAAIHPPSTSSAVEYSRAADVALLAAIGALQLAWLGTVGLFVFWLA